MRGFRHWRWHLDEMSVKLNEEMVYLWRAVGHEGEILESYITKARDKDAALRFMKKALKRHGSPEAITTDGLRSYRAAMKDLGNAEKQEVGRWANNRVENSHLSFRRRERAMLRFRRMKTLQKFAPSMEMCTTTPISNAISSTARPTRNVARLRWPNGLWADDPIFTIESLAVAGYRIVRHETLSLLARGSAYFPPNRVNQTEGLNRHLGEETPERRPYAPQKPYLLYRPDPYAMMANGLPRSDQPSPHRHRCRRPTGS